MMKEGLTIKDHGFCQRLPQLLLQFIKAYPHVTVGETQLSQVKQRLIQQWDSRAQQAPYQQDHQTIQPLNSIPDGILDQRRALLAEITLKEVLSYRDRLLHQATLDIVAIGDLGAAQF